MCGDRQNIKLLEIYQELISENNLFFVAYTIVAFRFPSKTPLTLTFSPSVHSSLSTKLANVSFLAKSLMSILLQVVNRRLYLVLSLGEREIFVDTKPTTDHRKMYIKNPCQSHLDFPCENRKCTLTFWLCHGILFLQMRE